MPLKTDIPTRGELERLLESRGPAEVSIYLETSPVTQEAQRSRIELKNLAREADVQLERDGVDRREREALEEHLTDLHDDDEFWAQQARSLAIFATANGVRTFRLPSHLGNLVEVSDRYFVKPLLRSVTFPQSAFVLALSQSGARLLEFSPELPPGELAVPDLPSSAAKSWEPSLSGRSPHGRIQGSEGRKVRMRQFARRVDEALRPVLTGSELPLILAAAEPLESIYREVCSYPLLAPEAIAGNPDETPDRDLVSSAREVLDGLHARRLADATSLYAQRGDQARASDDLAAIARAATLGAVDTAFVDIEATVPGSIDDQTGAIELTDGSHHHYGVLDEIARRVLLARGHVLAVRGAEVPGPGPAAAIFRYPV